MKITIIAIIIVILGIIIIKIIIIIGNNNNVVIIQITILISKHQFSIIFYLLRQICRLCFQTGQPRDAISHFRRHIDFYKDLVGYRALEFEHYAWLSKQYALRYIHTCITRWPLNYGFRCI